MDFQPRWRMMVLTSKTSELAGQKHVVAPASDQCFYLVTQCFSSATTHIHTFAKTRHISRKNHVLYGNHK